MIDVQQRALSAFEEQPVVGLNGVEEERRGIGDERLEPFGVSLVLAEDGFGIERRLSAWLAIHAGKRSVLGFADVLHLVAEIGAIQVTEAYCVRPADLVAVAGANAATGGADGFAALDRGVHRAVLGHVPGEDHVGAIADHQVAAHLHAALDELIDLFEHCRRVDDHTAGDDRLHAGVENSAGYQREFIGLSAGDDGVPGVGATLIADDDVVLFGEQVYELALGLVAPLQADHTGSGHDTPFMSKRTVVVLHASDGEAASTEGPESTVQTCSFKTGDRNRSR